jgi:hypothetical protein
MTKTFAQKLREVKDKIKESSQNTYLRNIRRLRKVYGELPIPLDHKWIVTDKLYNYIVKQPLNVRRHLANSAFIALQVYDKTNARMKKLQQKTMADFDKDRKKRNLTDKQKSKIPVGGFDRFKKVITQMKRELTHVKQIDSLSDLSRFQDLLIISMYYEYPLRLDYATLKIGSDKTGNVIYKRKKKPQGWHIELRDFKTHKSEGDKKFKLNAQNQRLLNKFIPASLKLTKHGFLLSNKRGDKMTKQVLSKRLSKITSQRIGKSFSVQLLRILFAMRNRDVIESAKEVSDKLLHSQKQSLQYAKKDD